MLCDVSSFADFLSLVRDAIVYPALLLIIAFYRILGLAVGFLDLHESLVHTFYLYIKFCTHLVNLSALFGVHPSL